MYFIHFFKWIFCIQKGEILSKYKGSARWKFVVLFSIFALIVVACGGDAVEEEVSDNLASELLKEKTSDETDNTSEDV